MAADGRARSAAREEVTAARILLAVCLGLVVKGVPVAIPIESSAFSEGGPIPRPYTCDGKDTSPPLSWSGVPEGAKSLALICDDPDASKTFVHWVVFDLPPGTRKLPEGIPPRDEISGGGKQGTNDFRKLGYGGPCPPGGTHRYFFKLYALDTEVKLAAGATKADLERAMKGHVLAEGALMGKYSRG
jgi:Raf kinase inhibitor-like YbhB/YbcL family protein